jgi:hypothetical protein
MGSSREPRSAGETETGTVTEFAAYGCQVPTF